MILLHFMEIIFFNFMKIQQKRWKLQIIFRILFRYESKSSINYICCEENLANLKQPHTPRMAFTRRSLESIKLLLNQYLF